MPGPVWTRLRRPRTPSGPSSGPGAAERPTFVVGDVHGHAEVLLELLRRAGLVGRSGAWCGRDARLVLVGDLVDRGPDGIGAIDLVRRLQQEGDVSCLLGNHELLLLGAYGFPDVAVEDPVWTFRRLWELNGGEHRDLDRLRDEHVTWLQSLPAMSLEGETLVVHADSDMYLRHGASVDAVNDAFRSVLASGDTARLHRLLVDATERNAFADAAVADRVLHAFGARRLVHGHTPIALVLDRPPSEVTEPFVYADGRCVNVDHGLFLGGPGFVTELSELPSVGSVAA